MLWYLPWSENIKKRACRYLLQRYLGNFLEEKLTLDQLSVDLYNGTGTVSEVSLDCEALNDLGDSQNWPLEIVDGYMRQITVTIPWSTLLKDDSVVEVNGLCLTVQPKVRNEPVSSMLESMWSSMSSSMQLAAECLREEDGPPEAHPVEGIEMFAHAIDSILSRVKVRFVNTKIRIEHVPKNSDRGIALEIHIKHIDYYDEAGSEPPPDVTDPEKPKTYIVSTYTNKRLMFEGVTLFTDEFPSKLRTMARSLVMEKSASTQPDKAEGSQVDASELNFQSTLSDVFYETRSVITNAETEPSRNEFVEQVLSDSTFKREATPDERANQPEPILFAKLTGRQELALKIKHSEEAVGPKVDLQMTLGSLIVFLTPRQLHTIVELVDGLNQPHLEDTSNIPLRQPGVNMQCKPMGQVDFQRVEAQLLGNFSREPAKTNFGTSGWTGQSFEESDAEDRFHPMTSAGNPATDSFTSSASSISTSMTSSVHMPALQPRIKRNRKVPQIDGDPTAEVSHINIKMSSCSCILLHKDILVPVPLGTDCVTSSSTKKMQQASAEFFERLGLFALGGSGRRDLDLANETFDRATSRSHLRLITSALTLDGSEKTTSHGSQTCCEGSVTHLLVRETLFYKTYESDASHPQSFDLIRFECKEEESADDSPPSALQPNVRVTFRQTLKFMRISGEKKLVYPTTDVTIKCMPILVDVELTLLERMSASIFGGAGVGVANCVPAQPVVPAPSAQAHLNFTVQCDAVDAILSVGCRKIYACVKKRRYKTDATKTNYDLIAFPIADLRPGLNREVRRVRPDYLLFKFQDVLVNSQQAPSVRPLPTTVTVRATTLDLYYHENGTSPGTHIARASMDDSFDTNILRGTVASLPTISLSFQPRKPPKGPFDPLSDEECYEPAAANPMTTSMHMMKNMRTSVQPTPFSNKKTAHQSITKHEDQPQGKVEELIVPGSEEEMSEFTSHSVEHSAIHLDLYLPVLSLQLESKQLYEIVYNRINSDLLLWEPQLTEQFEISPHMTYPTFNAEPSIYPAFGMCKGAGYESDSASSSSEEENLYYSTYESKLKQRKAAASKPVQEKKDSHNFCLTLKVDRGLLSIYAPVRDSNKRVVPGQMGELVLEAAKLSMCQVSGLYGRAKTAQLCLRAASATLYHDALMSIPSEKPSLRLYGTALPPHLKETIYPSARGVMVKDQALNKDMLSLALDVEPQPDLPNFKKICLTVGIEQASLRHRGHVGHAWLTQLLDVLDVCDYPVPGYQPSNVLTELHVHVWDCAVDYRPLYLPIRTVVALGNFSVASNVIAQTNTSSLRFLAQDCALYLSHLAGCQPNAAVPQDDGKQPEVARDYVRVLDIGLFELSLRIADKASTSGPHVDLCASNNIVNMHTCWDSASALCRLVTYAACDGDALPPAPSSRHASVCSERGIEPAPLVGLEDHPEEIRELSPSEIQQVNDMMAEAMKESPNTTLEDEDINSSTEKEGVEVFFFPDESNSKKHKPDSVDMDADQASIEFEDCQPGSLEVAEEARPTNAQVAKDLGDPSAPPRSSTPQRPQRSKKRSGGEGNNTDDEYCIVDAQAPCEDDDLAEPAVRWYGPEPVPMVENHFTVPAAKSDVLKAPKSFPVPTLRYTLCEMSIVWHLYGGHDFRMPGDNTAAPGKKVTISDERHGSPTAAKRNVEYEPYEAGRHVTSQYRQSGVRWTAGTDRVRSPLETRPATRDRTTSVRVSLNKVKFQHETYPAGGTHAARQTLAIGKIEILDRLANSHINKFLSQYALKDEPERKNAHMLVIKAVHLRPEPTMSAQECCLKISLLPLRFNIDQDTLAFLVGFFSKLGTDEASEDDTKSVGGSSESGGSRQATPTHRPPVMSVGKGLRDPPPTPTSLGDADSLSLNDASISNEEPLMETYEAERLVSENLIQLEEDFQRLAAGQPRPPAKQPDAELVDDSPVYFRRVVFSPEVPIRLDYVGKRVDLSAGPVAGLLMGLGQLNCSELRLKRLYHRHGLLGLERLVKWALHEWLADIKRHQLPGLLGGIGPMHSLLQFVTGIRDLLWLPVEQWRRDGRLVHGIRRGAASFTARTAVAALDITARILHVIQATAETAFDMLTPGPTLQLQDAYDRRERRRRRRHDPSRHPTDIREGVASAYQLVKEGFAETATTMAIAARSERGVGVLRHLPGAAVAPLALAAAGAADVIGGVRAHLAPDSRRDHADKWRPHTEPATD